MFPFDRVRGTRHISKFLNFDDLARASCAAANIVVLHVAERSKVLVNSLSKQMLSGSGLIFRGGGAQPA